MKSSISGFLIVLAGCLSVYGQNKQLLYDFNEIPQGLMVNPGMQMSYQWYAGVPLLSGIAVQAGTSGITVNDIFADDGIDINLKIRERAVFGLSKRDEFGATVQLEILNGGFRSGNGHGDFYSFGIYLEEDLITYWPQDLAILGYEGNADNLGRRFNLGHLKTRGELLSVFHFGVNRQVRNNLTLGARGKIYSSIFNFNSTRNKGHFVTNEGQNNLLSNTLVADMMLRTSGLKEIEEILDDDTVDSGSAIASLLRKRALLGGNLGLGFDVGFSYNLNEQTIITGSLLDVGFIYHTKDIETVTLKGEATVEGVEVIFPEALVDPNRDFWQDLVDEVEGLVPFETTDKSYISFRPTKLYGSIRHDFGKPLNGGGVLDCDCTYNGKGSKSVNRAKYTNSVGGQVYVINRPRGPQAALTAFYQRRFGNGLAVKAAYTADKFSFTNIGLGVNVQAGPVNFYLMADNLLAYRNIADSHYASLQFGLNIISWGSK
ncbi:DUF5723 family protein [Spongiimicrobium sp. 3-5]|uniref:DUF5723 family protein n=1 Tax=Spongiimicrobium sp. 3-5 TaxID=3332596 RepID=UPI0039805C80